MKKKQVPPMPGSLVIATKRTPRPYSAASSDNRISTKRSREFSPSNLPDSNIALQVRSRSVVPSIVLAVDCASNVVVGLDVYI
jgi:hypothetical protein